MTTVSSLSQVERLRLRELGQHSKLEPVAVMGFVLLAPNASLWVPTLRINNPLPEPPISEMMVCLETVRPILFC